MRTGEHLTPQEVRVLVKSDSEKTFARGMFGLVAEVGPTAAVVSLVVAVALACFVRFFLEEDVDLCELSLVSVRTRVLLRFDMLVLLELFGQIQIVHKLKFKFCAQSGNVKFARP